MLSECHLYLTHKDNRNISQLIGKKKKEQKNVFRINTYLLLTYKYVNELRLTASYCLYFTKTSTLFVKMLTSSKKVIERGGEASEGSIEDKLSRINYPSAFIKVQSQNICKKKLKLAFELNQL